PRWSGASGTAAPSRGASSAEPSAGRAPGSGARRPAPTPAVPRSPAPRPAGPSPAPPTGDSPGTGCGTPAKSRPPPPPLPAPSPPHAPSSPPPATPTPEDRGPPWASVRFRQGHAAAGRQGAPGSRGERDEAAPEPAGLRGRIHGLGGLQGIQRAAGPAAR